MVKTNCKIRLRTDTHRVLAPKANVSVIIYDENKLASPAYSLNKMLHDDVYSIDVVLPDIFSRAVMIEIWRKKCKSIPDWYLVVMEIDQLGKNTAIFPVFRSIVAEPIKILELNNFLPQDDPNREQRSKEIELARTLYEVEYNPDMPIVVKELPKHEEFGANYEKELFCKLLQNLIFKAGDKLTPNDWNSFSDIDLLYTNIMPKPMAAYFWKKDSWFGNQRLVGCNPSLITLCTEIPEKFGVTECMMKPVLQEETLDSLIKQKRLFLTDLAILDGIINDSYVQMCTPMALFMLDGTRQLLPIAIQLNQQKGPDNPVFLPTDDDNVWLMAKLWYNNADSFYHQSVLHLGWTHFLMERVYLALRRNVSVSHPIFKLLAPHTLYLLAIDSLALAKLLSKGGWVDSTMSIGVSGMYQLVSKSKDEWRFDLQGTPLAEFKSRNVEDPEVLPNYYFRDDTLLIDAIIRNYVTDYVHLYYKNDQILLDDWEMQKMAADLAEDPSENGFGMAGVPERDGKGGFNTLDDLIMLLSAVVYTCSADHAAANFLQYDEYAYPPNYPTQIHGVVINDKEPRKEEDILKALPNKAITLNVMAITNVLSAKATNSLGDFEIQYNYDPEAIKIVTKFKADLLEASTKMKERNKQTTFSYEVLLPENIPNAISI